MSAYESHLSSLRSKSRRERLEWLGDAVMEEALARLMAREALAALKREDAGLPGVGVPPTMQPLSQRIGEALGLAVSNVNLSVVYAAELGRLAASLGVGQDDLHLKRAASRGRRCSSNLSPSTGLACNASSPKGKRQKCRPDLVESVIGEAFEASLSQRGKRMDSGKVAAGRAQQFAGGHRASLVDRLLSAALSTETVLDYLEAGRVSGRSTWKQSQQIGTKPLQADFRNQFAPLDGSEDEEGSEGGRGLAEEETGSRTSHELYDARELSSDKRVECPRRHRTRDTTNKEGGSCAGLSDTRSEGSPSRSEAASSAFYICTDRSPHHFKDESDLARRTGLAGDEKEKNEREAPKTGQGEGCAPVDIDAGRESAIRLYGAALLKFRVSIHLFCSTPADVYTPTADDGSVGSQQSPRELTIRRQRVMCTENLEAVASYLQSIEIDTAGADQDLNWSVDSSRKPALLESCAGDEEGPSSKSGRGVVLSPVNWLRVSVGDAALSSEGTEACFSTKVAALLLSRVGERGWPASLPRYDTPSLLILPKTTPRDGPAGRIQGNLVMSVSCSDGAEGGAVVFASGSTRCRQSRVGVTTAGTMALTEAHFSVDPWPAKDLPRASAKAAEIFSSRSTRGRRQPPFLCKTRAAGDSAPEVSQGIVDATHTDIVSETMFDERNDIDDLERPRRPSRKRKREREQDSQHSRRCPLPRGVAGGGLGVGKGQESDGSSSTGSVPPHYADLVGSLPKEKRHLLARLGHHGYVKVLESLLDRFARQTPCSVPSVDKGTETDAKWTLDDDQGVSGIGAGDSTSEACAGVNMTEERCPRKEDPRFVSTKNPRQDGAEETDPWFSLGTPKPHPLLCGLVEPSNLALAEPDRLVLPIPNPFYRRVLHALCLVHGLRSQAGDVQVLGGHVLGDRHGRRGDAAEERYRTVEIRRESAQRTGCTKVASRGAKAREVQRGLAAGGLVPVEVLLGSG